MEIKVTGVGEKSYKPDSIEFNFSFNIKRKTYNQCLEQGTKSVEDYFKFLTLKGFNKEEIQTNSFNIHRERNYNNETKKYEDGDYVFSFNCKLAIDYDLKMMAQIMEETSKIKECPTYRIDFTIKDEKYAIDELMALAYKNAEYHAQIIARASGKTLKDCVKVSFEPFEGVSSNCYEGERLAKGCASTETIENIFVPKDIELDFELHTLWIAE